MLNQVEEPPVGRERVEGKVAIQFDHSPLMERCVEHAKSGLRAQHRTTGVSLLGDRVEVLGPPELRAQLGATVRTLAGVYAP